MTGSGDPFGSKIFRELLFSINGSQYPNVKINLQTNGVMFTEKYWSNMSQIHNNISNVLISLDASSEEVYKITRRGGSWPTLMKNLKFISELRADNRIKFVRLDFVVQKNNYRDMVGFINIGKKFNVDECYFALISNWDTWSAKEFEQHAIWESSHPEFRDFIDVMTDPIFDDSIVNLGNVTSYHTNS